MNVTDCPLGGALAKEHMQNLTAFAEGNFKVNGKHCSKE